MAVTDADREFVEELLKQYTAPKEEILWMQWVEGCMGRTVKKLHRRCIVIGRYRMFVIKKGGLFGKNSLEKDLPWFDLVEIREQAKDFIALDFSLPGLPTQQATLQSVQIAGSTSGAVVAASEDVQKPVLPLAAPDLTVHVKAPADKLKELIRHARVVCRQLTWGIPDAISVKLSVYGELLEDLPAFTATAACNFEQAYLGRCSSLTKPSSEVVIKHVNDKFSENSLSLTIEDMPGTDPKSDSAISLQPVLAALSFNTYFTSLSSHDVAWDQASDATALGSAVRTNRTLMQLIINRASLSDLSELGYGLAANRQHKIVHLDLSYNNLNDKTMAALTEALSVYPHSLKVLSLEGCAISPKALQGLFDGAFCKNYGMSLSLQELYIGGNTLGAEGSAGLNKWLDQVKSYAQLRRLSIASVNSASIGTLLKFITPCAPKLHWFDMSNNRVEDVDLPFLQTFLVAVHSHLDEGTPGHDEESPHRFVPVVLRLSNTQLSQKGAQLVFQAIKSNKLAKNIALDISSNPGVDERSIPVLVGDFKSCESITKVCFAETKLKLKGIQLILDNMPPYVTELVLDDAFSGAETDELTTTIGRWLARTPIERLSLKGSKSTHLRRAVIPFFSYLNSSITLRHVHVDFNHCGDSAIFRLADALRDNKTLYEVTLDRNQISFSGLQALHAAVMRNRSLKSLGHPYIDLDKMRSSATTEQKHSEINRLWFEIQSNLAKNSGTGASRPSSFAPLEAHLSHTPVPTVVDPLASLPSFLGPSTTPEQRARSVQPKPVRPNSPPATTDVPASSSTAIDVPAPPDCPPPPPPTVGAAEEADIPPPPDFAPPPPPTD